jgi:hypothetical protein
VALDPGQLDDLPLVVTPPTPTLPPTSVSPPGLAQPTPFVTRLPTFTPAPEFTPPAFEGVQSGRGGFPAMILILALLAVGIFGGVMAFIRRRV